MKAVELLSIQAEIERAKGSLITDRLDMSFGEIMNMYQDGELVISPEFQRHFRWDDHRKTRFIESILLGIPIPAIFVAENADDTWQLIDGLQRISTLLSFFGILKTVDNQLDTKKNNWTLCEGDFIKSMAGKKKDDLPLKLQRAIKITVCRVEILRWNGIGDKTDLKYEVFSRINAGSEPITAQAIRNTVIGKQSNEFNLFLNKLSKNELFKKLIEVSKHQDEQLFLQELVLRFISLYLNNYQLNMNDNISKYMTQYMRLAVEDKSFPYEITEKLFYRVLQLLDSLSFKIFRLEKGGFSTSIFDVVMIGIARNIDFYEKNIPILNERIHQFKQSGEWKNISSDKGKNHVKRLELANKIFKINSL
jgi:Protein of unknown function DUF262